MTEMTHQRAYSILLLRLNELLAADRDDDEADAIRDKMDYPWRKMTEEERQRVRWLSVDLDRLENGREPQTDTSPAAIQRFQAQLQPYWNTFQPGRNDRVLELLRSPDAVLHEPGVIEYLQGRTWTLAGFPEVGIRFMEEAEKFKPSYACVTLPMMNAEGWRDRAYSKARHMLRTLPADPIAVYLASATLLDAVRNAPLAEARPVLEPAREILGQTWRSLKRGKDIDPFVFDGMAMTLGACLVKLGLRKEGFDVFSEAITSAPQQGDLYALRVMARPGDDAKGSMDDLRAAVAHGTSWLWAFVDVANDDLRIGRPADALRLTNGILAGPMREYSGPRPEEAVAYLLQARAIAKALLGQPKDWVLEDFDAALKLLPTDPNISLNRKKAAGGAKVTPSEWDHLAPAHDEPGTLVNRLADYFAAKQRAHIESSQLALA